MRAAVITCSDSAAAGTAANTSGPLAASLLGDRGFAVLDEVVVADDVTAIAGAIGEAAAAGARLIVTTGGTGAGPRDVTPEALRALGLRELPGLGELIRASSRDRVPTADLSRALGGVLDGVVVLALPGSPGGVRDGLAAVGALLEHAVAIAGGGGHPGDSRGSAGTLATVAPQAHAGVAAVVSDAPLSQDDIAAVVARPDAGAVVTFVGAVRDHDHGRRVTALRYEGHPDAGRILAEVVADATNQPGVLGAAAHHRVGDLIIGDLAFVAAVSAAHRAEAFAACAWLVDEVKQRLPIWKHQQFSDGTDEWVNCA